MFYWYVDADEDNIPETLKYSTTMWLPNLDDNFCGRNPLTSSFQGLNGDSVVLSLKRTNKNDSKIPGQFTLEWEVADPNFVPIAEWCLGTGKLIGVSLPHRWRQLQVTSERANQITVAAGYWNVNGDTFYLLENTSKSVNTTHTKVNIKVINDEITCYVDDEVPETQTNIATINVAAGTGIVTINSPTGVENMRKCRIIKIDRPTGEVSLYGMTITLQEIL